MSGAQAWLTSRSKEWKTNISPRNIFDFMVQRMERCSSLGTTQITHPHARIRTHAQNKYIIVILRKDFSKPYRQQPHHHRNSKLILLQRGGKRK